MTRLIQIAPGVLFSSDVFSPEWGKVHQRNGAGVEAGRNVHAAEPSPSVATEGETDTPETLGGQLLLL